MLGTMNKLGVLGTMVAAVLNLGCCAEVFGPIAAVLFAGGLLDRVPAAWQMPLLYGSSAAALLGFGLGWRRHRQLAPLLLFLAGAVALLYPFHEALDVFILKIFMWLGFSLLLMATGWDTWLSFRARSCRFPISRTEASQ